MQTPVQSAQQVHRRGEFDLDCGADIAFPLFSPEGEREWIKEWNPRPVFPEEIEFRSDTVFRQGEDVEEAVWTIIGVDWRTHRAEYVRAAAASHAAHIVVKVDALAPARCRVAVDYKVTAWGEHAPALLNAFSASAYETKMKKWQRMIGECLKQRDAK